MIRTQSLSKIWYLTIHCSASLEGQDLSAAQIAAIGRARFGQPSYHHVVELNGRVTRLLDDTQIGAHVARKNTGNIGIVYVGGLTPNSIKGGKPVAKDTRTLSQRMALRRMVEEYRERFPGIKVLGHRDWSPDRDGDGVIERHEWLKDCPCFDVATQL